MRSFIRSLAVALALTAAVAYAAPKRSKKHNPPTPPPTFSYYLLTLTWAPDFCEFNPSKRDPRECGKGRKIGFVVHGLWPQGETQRGPENCTTASPVSQEIIRLTLPYVPTEGLIQHEWSAHGTCSGLSAADYFAALRKARDSVKIPDILSAPAKEQQLSAAQIEAAFAAANPSFPKTSFRVSCSNQALQEARICFTKDLKPHPCTDSAGECTLGTMRVLPVQ